MHLCMENTIRRLRKGGEWMDKTYKTAIMADYFTEDELVKKIGLPMTYWNDVVLKELIDNALDSIEPLADKRINIIRNIGR